MPLGGGFYYVGFFYVGHSGSDSARISDKGSPANLVGARWLNNRNAILRTLGRAGAKLTPASARRNDGGHVGDVGIAHMAATAPIAVMGCTGHLMAYVVDADVPAPLGGEAPGPSALILIFVSVFRPSRRRELIFLLRWAPWATTY